MPSLKEKLRKKTIEDPLEKDSGFRKSDYLRGGFIAMTTTATSTIRMINSMSM